MQFVLVPNERQSIMRESPMVCQCENGLRAAALGKFSTIQTIQPISHSSDNIGAKLNCIFTPFPKSIQIYCRNKNYARPHTRADNIRSAILLSTTLCIPFSMQNKNSPPRNQKSPACPDRQQADQRLGGKNMEMLLVLQERRFAGKGATGRW